MKEAFLYASADPDLRPTYIQMALENGKNPRHPYDMAVSLNTQNTSPPICLGKSAGKILLQGY